MYNLIRSGLHKLFKTAIYRMCAAFMAFMPLFVILVNLSRESPKGQSMYGLFNVSNMYMGLVIAVFVSLYVGREYSDNVIRNKLMAGHSRAAVYISQFIVSFIGAVILQLTTIASACVFSIPIYGMFEQPFEEIVKIQLLVLCTIAVYTAAAILLTVIITNKAYIVTASLIGNMVFFMLGMGAYDLKTREKNNEAENISASETAEEIRAVDILYDCIPQAQACVLSEGPVPENAARIVIYDIGWTALATAAGILIYRKKDIR